MLHSSITQKISDHARKARQRQMLRLTRSLCQWQRKKCFITLTLGLCNIFFNVLTAWSFSSGKSFQSSKRIVDKGRSQPQGYSTLVLPCKYQTQLERLGGTIAPAYCVSLSLAKKIFFITLTLGYLRRRRRKGFFWLSHLTTRSLSSSTFSKPVSTGLDKKYLRPISDATTLSIKTVSYFQCEKKCL